jgi:DNA-binding HxlR family transcriptional regulator
LDGISYKVLTETLRRAERERLIALHLDGERIETSALYELTDLGRSLDAPLAAMDEWTKANWQAVETARRRWDRLRRASLARPHQAMFTPARPSLAVARCGLKSA